MPNTLPPPALLNGNAAQFMNGTGQFSTPGGTGASTALDNLAAVAINQALTLGTSDAAALGSTTKQWSDLFLAEGGVIDWDNGDATLTQAGNVVTLAGANFVADTVTVNTSLLPDANDGAALGVSGTAFSDLFLASGALIDFAAGNAVITHSSAVLTVSTGDLRVTTAGSNSASAVTVGGSQTLTNKTLTAPIVDVLIEPAVDDTYSGPSTNDLNAGATIAQWDLCYLDSSSTWQLVDADAAATTAGMLAMAAAAGTAANPMLVCLPGCIIRNDGWSWTAGAILYASVTPGALSATQPVGTDDVIRVIGYALTDDCIYFDPSPDYITHT